VINITSRNAQIAAFYRPFTSVVQKIALTAIFDQAALFKLEVTPARPQRPARIACKSMNCVQKQMHLAQANWHIAELAAQILRQRVIVKHALDTGQRSEMAESLLDALEGSLRLFEKHRIFLLSRSGSRHDKDKS
jgi:hypothetical protein